jgi:hypothetical protein
MARRKRKPTGVHDPFGIAAGASRRHAHLQRPSSEQGDLGGVDLICIVAAGK